MTTDVEQELPDLAFITRVDRAQAASILGVSPTTCTTRFNRLRRRIATRAGFRDLAGARG